MFNEEEDWSDDEDAQVLSKSVLNSPQKPDSSKHVKSKAVGKKSLLRTLQTLGSVPEWQSDGHQRGSDSETETAAAHSKRKKKHKKKRKQAETAEEQQENGDIDETGGGEEKEEKPQAKKRKKDNKFSASKANTESTSESKDVDMIKSGKVNVNKPENTQRLSRKQWKNKMKSKKQCKNKFKLNQPEVASQPDTAEKPKPSTEVKPDAADKAKPKEKAKTESNGNNESENNSQTSAKRKEKKSKPQKSVNTEEGNDEPSPVATKTFKKEKQLEKKQKKTKDNEAADKPIELISHEPVPVEQPKPALSKVQILKRERLQKILETQHQEPPAEKEPEPEPDRSSFRSRMEQRLDSARFRYINELLYSTTSGEARRMFKQDPDAFSIYHKGYTAQVERWPTNPVDQIISFIRQKSSSLVVADFGCGDCKIARSVKNKVHSFDLASTCDLVTVCDMAKVPLKDASVDIAVFCLSLMGTNLADFLSEANRVLKMGGVLKIAEVASRFENIRSFITALAGLGFKSTSKDTENTHFYSFDFLKTANAPENVKKFGLQLRPCLYKKR